MRGAIGMHVTVPAKPKFYRHRETGNVYIRLSDAFLRNDTTAVVVYQSMSSDIGTVWVMPRKEFDDGRFVQIHDPIVKDRLKEEAQ